MPKVTVRFYEELNEYLPLDERKKDVEVRLEGRSTVREILRGRGIPQGEVDLVLVNGHSVALDHVVQQGDRVSFYPVFERFDVSEVTRLRRRPLRILRFVAEESLRETAERMKDLGFDVMCTDLQEAMEISRTEKRILLTKKSDVAKSGGLTHVLHVAPGRVEDQLREILRDLYLL
jgi:sulfur carrier protein ThiS